MSAQKGSLVRNANFCIILAMKITVIALDGVFDTGLAAIQDTLATAADLSPEFGAGSFKVDFVGVRDGVATAHGLRVPTVVANPKMRSDFVVVPAIGAKTAASLPKALSHPDIAAAGQLIEAWRSRGALTAAACTGTFVLAENGLLDGQVATTSWWLGPFFRQRYPQVALDDDRMLVRSNEIVTAGAVLAHFDLALWLVRQKSPELAATTARYLMLDARSSQAAYVIPDHLSHTDLAVERFERWARKNLSKGFSLDEAARAVGASPRTLARKLKKVLGKTPLSYFQDLRIERAVHLLQSTQDSVDRIAEEVGYAEGVTLRNLLRRRLGRGAAQLRRGIS